MGAWGMRAATVTQRANELVIDAKMDPSPAGMRPTGACKRSCHGPPTTGREKCVAPVQQPPPRKQPRARAPAACTARNDVTGMPRRSAAISWISANVRLLTVVLPLKKLPTAPSSAEIARKPCGQGQVPARRTVCERLSRMAVKFSLAKYAHGSASHRQRRRKHTGQQAL